MAGGGLGLFFVGVDSFGMESNERTDWLYGMVETATNEAVGAAVFMAWRWLCVSVMSLMASQSSSSP